jgi:hypothetical protein
MVQTWQMLQMEQGRQDQHSRHGPQEHSKQEKRAGVAVSCLIVFSSSATRTSRGFSSAWPPGSSGIAPPFAGPGSLAPIAFHGQIDLDEAVQEDPDRYRTETQKEWAAWAAHGYRKLYQPGSIRRFGLVFTVLLSLLIVSAFWLATHGHLP